MNAEQIEELFKTSDRLVGAVSTDFHRYLEVDWRDRLICIAGARGTGKTTMLRQRMKETFGVGSNQAICISLDDLYFSQYRVRDVVDGKWTFEVGGKGKTFKQIADVPNSFVVNDDIEVGVGSKIPLWLFGFLY